MPTLGRILCAIDLEKASEEHSTVRSISRSSARRSCTSFTRRRRTFLFPGARLNGFSTSPAFGNVLRPQG